ncbi:MAG: hypothetical protein M1820_004470 [Bogoriella megaspora]|nr:MAG: hypothetical protein M1820_004470 [Bogoriella megaspora]
MNTPASLRLTPHNSPSLRHPPSTRSPTRHSHDEQSLSLKSVIGSTIASANGFDCHPARRSFAYTAGAAAVIATVDDGLGIKQRFFRARPTTSSNLSGSYGTGPATPTPSSNWQEPRNKTVSSLREAGVGRDPVDASSRGWGNSPGGKPWAGKDRIKAATAVSLSPDGKYLAVGETGHKPRVLIFSAELDQSSDLPLSSTCEHLYGVHSVAFSPDSQFLASLGNVNDGFLHIWRIGPRGNVSLHSSNKCTSTVRHMAWVGSSLVTVGTRHVKVWRLDGSLEDQSPKKPRASEFGSPVTLPSATKSLPGRNALLGDLLESIFTAVVPVTPTAAVICSDRGDVCILDIGNGQQSFRKALNAGFAIWAAAYNGTSLAIAGDRGNLSVLRLSDIETSDEQSAGNSPPASPNSRNPNDVAFTAAIAGFGDQIILADSQRGIEVFEFPPPLRSLEMSSTIRLPGHGNPVLGVQSLHTSNPLGASFYTWSSDGWINFWDINGELKSSLDVPLNNAVHALHNFSNELRVVRAFSRITFLATGDKSGVLRILKRERAKTVCEAQAHSGEILDIAVFDVEGINLICTSGRDRIVQIFQYDQDNLTLLQSLDEHVGAVTGLSFTPDDARLLSCSSDRAVVIRDRLVKATDTGTTSAFVISKTIALKSAAVAMTLMNDDTTLVVSCMDRSVMLYDTRANKAINTFKATDLEKGDPVILSALATWTPQSKSSIIAGVSSTDKSVRLYQEDATLIGRDWGHTEGVTDVAVVHDHDSDDLPYLVTVAADGTIFIWSLFQQSFPGTGADRIDSLTDPPFPLELRVTKPIRRLLSQSDLASFRPASETNTPRASPTATPDLGRSPKLRTRASRVSLVPTPKLEPLTTTAGTSSFLQSNRRRQSPHRSPTPPVSPKQSHSRTNNDLSSRGPRRPSLDVRHRTKSTGNLKSHPPSTPNLHDSTTQIIRSLKSYRRTLSRSPSTSTLSLDTIRDVEKELNLTAKALAEKAARGTGVGEEVLHRLFDEYSERIVRMLDERVEKRMAERDNKVGSVAEESEHLAEEMVGLGIKDDPDMEEEGGEGDNRRESL